MTDIESKNPRKRVRDKQRVNGSHSADASNGSPRSPPTKKRRISTKPKRRSSRTRKMEQWTITELKDYLSSNGITFQMNKEKAYYLRQAKLQKKLQSKEKKHKKSKKSEPNENGSLEINGMNGMNGGGHGPEVHDDVVEVGSSTSSTSETPSMAIFATPLSQQHTPPLPPNLIQKPLNADFSSDNFDEAPSDDGNDSEPEAVPLSQTNLSQNKPRTKIPRSSEIIETPQSSQTRVLMSKVTPTSTMATIIDEDDDHELEPNDILNGRLLAEGVDEMSVPHSEQQHQGVVPHGQPIEPETNGVLSQSLSDSNTPLSQQLRNRANQQRGLDLLPPRYPQPQGFEIGVYHSNDGTPSSVEASAERTRSPIHDQFAHRTAVSPYPPLADPLETTRFGPFQDMGRLFRLDGVSMPTFPRWSHWSDWNGINITVNADGLHERNKFVLFLTATLGLIMMAICIPYIMTMIIPTPFCDHGDTRIMDRFAVMNGIIPLEQIIDCRPCPLYAKCANGTAECGTSNVTDPFGVICIPNGDEVASSAAIMAQRMDFELGLKLGERQCLGTERSVYSGIKEEVLRDIVVEKYYQIGTESEGSVPGGIEEAEGEGTGSSDDVVTEQRKQNEPNALKLDVISQSMFDDSWQFALRFILPEAYGETVAVYGLSGKGEDVPIRLKALMVIEPSLYCRGMYLYREYVEKKDIDIGVAAGFATIVVVVIIAVTCLLRRRRRNGNGIGDGVVMMKQYGPDVMKAADFVMAKLEQQQNSHFSVDQFKRYTMNRLNVTQRVWDQTVEFLNASESVMVVQEDFNGALRPCWKWNASRTTLQNNEC